MKVKTEISLLDIDNINEVEEFVSVKNKAYEHRSCERMPFIMRTKEELFEKTKNGFCIKAVSEGRIVGGAGCTYMTQDNIQIGEIFWVFVDPDFCRGGIAGELMKSVEEKAVSDGVKCLKLYVYVEAIPAVKLYEKSGFKRLKVIPINIGRSFMQEYIKVLPPYKFSELKRLFSLYYSKFKCKILYKKGSYPTFIYK